MIDKWFKKDLEQIFSSHPVAVFIDESGECEFLLSTVKKDYSIYVADSEIDELHVKYLIEREQAPSQKTLIYTQTAKDQLKFIREYCETNGCIEVGKLSYYIKQKVHATLNLNINLPEEELVSAAKVSIGKDRTYWMDLAHKGATEIFDLNKELLPFIHDPAAFESNKYDAQLRETFYRKVNDLLKQDYVAKPAKTLAQEVVKAMLDGLAYRKCSPILKSVYNDWLDSVSYKKSFQAYLKNYKRPADIDIWEVSPNHPFRSVDEQCLKVIGENIGEKEALPNYLAKISQRIQSQQAQVLGIEFWADVKTLLDFDPKDISYLSSFSECVEFYTKHFYKLDTAIRNLYTEFLSQRDLLEPFQNHYKEMIAIFLDKWFKHWSDYKENQTGTLQRIIDKVGDLKTAIIVGDGVAYEMACQIATKVSRSFKLTRDVIIADVPSETENNMSRIYMANGETEATHGKREKYLTGQNPDISIEYVKLDDVNEDARASQFLICTYKDIDSMGEKMQQKALQYFPEAIDYFAEKVELLLSSGYGKVYLISDHGFVLTGLLSESDKISVSVDAEVKKSERYIKTQYKQDSLHTECMVKEKQGQYLYFSKTINPFKTPSVYGFSHGGASPEEIITPYFSWERDSVSLPGLNVMIANREELQSVTGDLYQLNIKSEKGKDDLFAIERKVFLLFFSNKVQINKSDVFTIQRDQTVSKEYTFDGNPEIEVQLLDALTKEQLDRTTIKQNNDRDLGGLL